MRKHNALVVAAAMLTALAGCGSDSDSDGDSSSSNAQGVTDDTIMIGTSTPLTGVAAGNCKPVQDGAAAWIAKVNAEGGVHGRKIEQKVLDDAYVATEALANARELVKDSFVLFGGCGSAQVDTIQQTADQAKMPYLFPRATPADETLAGEFFRGLIPREAPQAGGIVDYIMETEGAGSLYLLSTSAAVATPQQEAVKKAVTDAGATLAGEDLLNQAGGGDVTPIVLKIADADPDYVYFGIQPADTARIIQGLAQQDALPKFFVASSSNMTSAAIDPVNGAADDIFLGPLVTPPGDDPASAECAAAFEEHGDGLVADASSLIGCAQAQTLVAALEDAGEDLTVESLMDALDSWEGKEVSSILPPLTFSDEQHLGMTSMPLGKVVDGKIAPLPGESMSVAPE